MIFLVFSIFLLNWSFAISIPEAKYKQDDNANVIQTTYSKQDSYYQPPAPAQYQLPVVSHPVQPQVQYVLVPKHLLMQQAATGQPLMLIIAQPVVPSPVVYNTNPAVHQLLNYYHSNPQAKHQLLYGGGGGGGGQQPVPAQSVVVPQYHTQLIPQYQYVQPTYQQVYATTAPTTQATPQHTQYINHLTQQSLASYNNKNAPALVTGLENFTKEQQAQIREQLSSYLGKPLQNIASNQLTANNQYSSKYGSTGAQLLKDFVPSTPVKNTARGSQNTEKSA